MRKLRWMAALTVLFLLSFANAAGADYGFDGFPLQAVRSGTIEGELFIDGGHGLASASPYTQSFQVPAGQVEWGRLYVGVWGGTENYSGTLSVDFNGSLLGTAGIGKDQAPGIAALVQGSGNGVWWVAVDVTDKVAADSTNRAELTTASISGRFDGRVYGAILVAALKQADNPTVSYSVAEGNMCLNYKTLDKYSMTFPGAIAPGDGDKYDLTTVYLTGHKGVSNSLFCNDRLLSSNAADGGGMNLNGEEWEDNYLDLDHWDVTGKLVSKDNQLIFERNETNYLHPVVVVLRSLTESQTSALEQMQTRTEAQARELASVQEQDMFTDIQNHWARPAINELARAGIIRGFDGQEFRPDGLVSRAQFAAMLVNARGLAPAAGAEPTFEDVPTSYWGYNTVETAATYKLVSGSNGKFYPDRPVTRQEMTVMLMRTADLESGVHQFNETDVNNLLGKFNDRDQISSWAKPYAAMAVLTGFIKGIEPEVFGPQESATRAQAAVIIQQLLHHKKLKQ